MSIRTTLEPTRGPSTDPFFLNVTVKQYEDWSTFAKVTVKIKVIYIFETRVCTECMCL